MVFITPWMVQKMPMTRKGRILNMASVEANITNPSPMSMLNRIRVGKPTSMKNVAAKSDRVMVIWKFNTNLPCWSMLGD